MTDRAAAVAGFLESAAWDDAVVRALAGDASGRSYMRLTRRDRTAVLMDAPPDRCGPVAPFLAMSRHLTQAGLSAPIVLAADPTLGLVLLEDLGDADFLRTLRTEPGQEETLYRVALDALLVMQATPLPLGVTIWDAERMVAVTRPAFEEGPSGHAGFDHWRGALFDEFRGLDRGPRVLCHRDFHAGNLFWLPDRAGPARVGIIDHQDAFAGHRAYDLVSLLTDARRDLRYGLPDRLIRYWQSLTGVAATDLRHDMVRLSVQRNLRVHGVLTRLARCGRPDYAAFLPRVRAHLARALEAVPRLAPLARDVIP